MNTNQIVETALGYFAGRALWCGLHNIQHRIIIRRQRLAAEKAQAKQKAETEAALASRKRATIKTVGKLTVVGRTMFGHLAIEIEGWEFVDQKDVQPHGHLPDGRCLYYGHTGEELMEIHRRRGEFNEREQPWRDGDGEEWKGRQ